MSYSSGFGKAEILDALRSGQTLSLSQHYSRYGLIDLKVYITDDFGIVVSPEAEHHADEMETQFYDVNAWDQIWQEWSLQAPIQAGEYMLG